jgi:hypothetical protein
MKALRAICSHQFEAILLGDFKLDFLRFNGRCFCASCEHNYREMFGEKLQKELQS